MSAWRSSAVWWGDRRGSFPRPLTIYAAIVESVSLGGPIPMDSGRSATIASDYSGGDGKGIQTWSSKQHNANVAAEASRRDSNAGLHRSEVLGDVQGRLSRGRCSTESIARGYSSLPDTGFRRRTRPQAESIDTELGRAVPVGFPDLGRRGPNHNTVHLTTFS